MPRNMLLQFAEHDKHVTPQLASRKDLLELGKRFQTLDGGNVVSVVSSADDTSNNSTRGSRTRLQGAIGSYATVLGDIQLGDLCPVSHRTRRHHGCQDSPTANRLSKDCSRHVLLAVFHPAAL